MDARRERGGEVVDLDPDPATQGSGEPKLGVHYWTMKRSSAPRVVVCAALWVLESILR